MIIECHVQAGLIGDSLSTIPFILGQAQHGEVYVTGDFADPIKPLCAGFPFKFEQPATVDKHYLLNCGDAWQWDSRNAWQYHMAQSYFGLHGFSIPNLYVVSFREHPCSLEPGIVISPFARSDGNFTKRWPTEYWQEIIQHFKGRKHIYVIGNSDDDMEPFWSAGAQPIQNWSFPYVLGLMRGSFAFVSIDTGTSHLATLAGLRNHILLYPDGLPPKLAENPRANILRGVTNRHIHVDTVRAAIEVRL